MGEVRTRRWWVLGTALLAAMVLSAGCGDDGDSSADGVGDDVAADDVDAGAGETDGSCDGLSATGDTPGNDSFTATNAVAVSLEGGKAYTVYLADFDLSLDDVSSFSTPDVPDDGTMFTLAVTVFNASDPEALEPIAPGQVVEAGGEFGELTFVVTAQDGEGMHGNSIDAEGTVEVSASGSSFCGTVTYSDGEKSLSGTFDAPVKAV